MNNEQQLEQIYNSIVEYKITKAPPIFELFASLVAMSISILLFLLDGVFLQDSLFYVLMRSILPQVGWAALFMTIGILSAAGMLTNSNLTRIVALILMTATYGLVATFYILIFPNLAGILMFWIAIFTGISIPMVRYTGLKK